MCYPAVCRAHMVWFERPRQLLIYEAHHTTAINRHCRVCCVCDGQQIGLRPGFAAIHGLDEMDCVVVFPTRSAQARKTVPVCPPLGSTPIVRVLPMRSCPKTGWFKNGINRFWATRVPTRPSVGSVSAANAGLLPASLSSRTTTTS